MQVFKFVKTNWFTVGLLLIVVVAVWRKNVSVSKAAAPAVPTKKIPPADHAAQPEKFTDEGSRPSEMARMDVLSSGGGRAAMPAVDEAAAMAFFQRFGKVVLDERKKFGIPASVAIACAYVNSFAGKRETVAAAQNYFALPCSPAWSGGAATVQGKCVRKYATAWESFRDFSQSLSSQEGFAAAKKSAGQNPRVWAQFVEKQGLTDVQNFEAEVEKAVRDFRLFELDKR